MADQLNNNNPAVTNPPLASSNVDLNTNKTRKVTDPNKDPHAPDAVDANRDPITGAPGAHPVGSGVGAAVGGTAGGVGTGVAIGAMAGAVGGPVGVAVGAAIGTIVGGVVGGLAGKGVAEHVNPTVEHDHWRNNYTKKPYYQAGRSYDDYAPAYQYGWESRTRYQGKKFNDVEPEMRNNWETSRGSCPLTWEQAKHAVRDSWDRSDSQVVNAGKTSDSGTMRSAPATTGAGITGNKF